MLHLFQSGKSDGPDTNQVRPSNWNTEHQGELFNFTFNGDFEVWGGGTSAAPTSWTLTGAGASAARNVTNFVYGAAAVDVVRSGADTQLYQDIDTLKGFGPASSWGSRSVTFAAAVRATAASRARLFINDGTTTTFSGYHTGGSAFEWLTVTVTLPSSPSRVRVGLQVDTGNTTAQLDGAIVGRGVRPRYFVPSGWHGRKCVLTFGATAQQAQATTQYYGPWGTSATEVDVTYRLPFKGVARNLQVLTDVNVGGAAQTATATIRYEETTDTPITAAVGSGARSASDTTHEGAFFAGDRIAVKLVTSATTGSVRVHATCEYEETP